MRFTRLAVPIVAMLIATPAFGQDTIDSRADSAFVREYPLALVYRGVARFFGNDYQGAIDEWQRYLAIAGSGADTASVNELIHQALTRGYPDLLVYEALAQAKGGDLDRAVRSLERYQELAGGSADTATARKMAEDMFFLAYPMARLYQGIAYYHVREFDKAIDAWEQYLAVAVDQDRAEVQKMIAQARQEWEDESVALRL